MVYRDFFFVNENHMFSVRIKKISAMYQKKFLLLLSNEDLFDSELLNFEYLLIDVARYTEEELLSLPNTIGSVFLLDQTEDQEHLLNRLRKLMNTIQQMPEDNQQKFVAWMANILLQKLPENERSLQQFIQSVKGDAAFMGLEKIFKCVDCPSKHK